MSELKTSTKHGLFEDAVDILLWLESDRACPHVQRLQRDRRIGQSLSGSELDDPIKAVRRWWQRISWDSPQSSSVNVAMGKRMARLRTLVSLLVGIFGFLSGLAIIVTVFQYDGSHPINVVTLIAVFGILQIVLIMLSLLMLLPGQNSMGSILTAINPGAILSALMQGRFADRYAGFDFFSGKQVQVLSRARFFRWLLFSWSQLMGLAFNMGALIAGMMLIVFTDLAFGWSSTLVLETREFQNLVHWIALPWSGIWLDAVPSDALIAQSRFFRLEAGAESAAQDLAAWWPFVVACMLCYGLIPRAVLLVMSRWLLRSNTRNMLREDLQVLALLDRMRSPEVSLGSVGGEVTSAPQVGDTEHVRPEKPDRAVPILIWAEAASAVDVPDYLSGESGLMIDKIYAAGGQRSLAEDRVCLSLLAENNPEAVLLIVKAWEPPLNEFFDFVSALRQQLSASTNLIIIPVATALAEVEAQHLRIWRHAVKRLSDDFVFVESRLK